MTFDDWFYELEGFTFRSERFWDDVDHQRNSEILNWLKTAYEIGEQHGKTQKG